MTRIHASRHPVDQIPCARMLTRGPYVLAYPTTMVALQTAVPNAPQTQSVRLVWLALMRNVAILALARVAGTPSVE